jgi:hypothetical protein
MSQIKQDGHMSKDFMLEEIFPLNCQAKFWAGKEFISHLTLSLMNTVLGLCG